MTWILQALKLSMFSASYCWILPDVVSLRLFQYWSKNNIPNNLSFNEVIHPKKFKTLQIYLFIRHGMLDVLVNVIMKVTLLGKVFRRKCAHFPAFSLEMHTFSSNLHKMHAFSLKMYAFSYGNVRIFLMEMRAFSSNLHKMHAFYWKCAHFPNLNNLRFRRPINIGLSYIYERPIK